ncbi:hypothetical protein ACLOJK_036872, partial [Asimina triloba]
FRRLNFSDLRFASSDFWETLPLSPVTGFSGDEMLPLPSTVRKKETSVVASVLPYQKKMTAMIGAIGSNGLLVR